MIGMIAQYAQRMVNASIPWLVGAALAYITANVDPEFQPYAWMIAKHESKSGGRVYNQFNPSNPFIELPNKTGGPNSWGWGIAQIDKGRAVDFS